MMPISSDFVYLHRECRNILSDLIVSFRDDFAKYRCQVPSSRFDAVFRSVAEQGQGKFVFTKVNAPIKPSRRERHSTLLSWRVWYIPSPTHPAWENRYVFRINFDSKDKSFILHLQAIDDVF